MKSFTSQSYSDADLLAYLDGQTNPALAQDLLKSEALQQRLKDLSALMLTFGSLFSENQATDLLDMVDVVANTATDQQKLVVAAQARANPSEQAQLKNLEQTWRTLLPKAKPKTSVVKLIEYLATPIFAGLGVRAGEDQLAPRTEQSYYVSELAAQVNFRIVAPVRDKWGLRGYVTRNDKQLSNTEVVLYAGKKRIKKQMTDEDGGFVFSKLVEGRYALHIKFATGILITPPFLLQD